MNPKTNENQTGYKAHCIQRGETFSVAFSALRIKPGFNKRKLFNGIPELAERIHSNGFNKQTPLIVEWHPTDKVFDVIHGERRTRACEHLVNKGLDPGPIWCMSETKGKDPIQQLFDQVLTNSGEPFTLLEKGDTYLDIQTQDPSTTGAEISRRVGETKQAVSNALRLAKQASNTLRLAIESGKLAATTALKIVETAGPDHLAQDQLLSEAIALASASGKSHATPKDLPATKTTDTKDTASADTFIAPPEDPSAPSDPPEETSSPNPQSQISNTSSLAPADPGAIERIKGASSTNRDGSTGPGNGFEPPDKRLKSIETILDTLDKKGQGDEDRITTTEIVLGYINNERTAADLKAHLLGK